MGNISPKTVTSMDMTIVARAAPCSGIIDIARAVAIAELSELIKLMQIKFAVIRLSMLFFSAAIFFALCFFSFNICRTLIFESDMKAVSVEAKYAIREIKKISTKERSIFIIIFFLPFADSVLS